MRTLELLILELAQTTPILNSTATENRFTREKQTDANEINKKFQHLNENQISHKPPSKS